MTKEEVCARYGIPPEVLDECERWGLSDAAKAVMEGWRYDGHDLEVLGMVLTLHDAGFEPDDVETYLRLALGGPTTRAKRLRMLDGRRAATLAAMHELEERLQKIDHLRYGTRREDGDATRKGKIA